MKTVLRHVLLGSLLFTSGIYTGMLFKDREAKSTYPPSNWVMVDRPGPDPGKRITTMHTAKYATIWSNGRFYRIGEPVELSHDDWVIEAGGSHYVVGPPREMIKP